VISGELLSARDLGAPLRGGYVVSLRGLAVRASGFDAAVGSLVEIEVDGGFVPAEVVGFRDGALELMPLRTLRGVVSGCRVWPRTRAASVPAGDFLLGRVIDALGEPADGGVPFPVGATRAPLYRAPIPPMERSPLAEPLDVGVASLNALTPFARGQRVGLFAGAGLGKSTLLGMMLRGTSAEVRVIGMVGERGREVREFVERELGDARRSTVVVAVTSDASPLLRVRGAYVATAIAEHFRDRGHQVLLMIDSLTRFAMAAREIGLARGEPSTTKGYTPSVFAELPNLLERAGCVGMGSITGVYSVLVEGDDLEDPIADALRAILDGHVVLSRQLAERGHFPAVDPLASVSRTTEIVASPEHRTLASRMRRLLAAYRDAQDLIQVGAYAAGSDADVDAAIARRSAIEAFLRQETRTQRTIAESLAGMRAALQGVAK
jgi:flagellum-specific ATP synthase